MVKNCSSGINHSCPKPQKCLANIVSANEEEASVAPAVVDAVAADINAPDIGAINTSLI